MSSICDRCQKVCKDNRGLAIHQGKCTEGKLIPCEHCSILFRTRKTLKNHLKTCRSLLTKKEEEKQLRLVEQEKQTVKIENEHKYLLLKAEYDKQTQELNLIKQTSAAQITGLKESADVQIKFRDEAYDRIDKEKKALLERIQTLESDLKERKDDIRRLNKNYDKTVNVLCTKNAQNSTGKTIVQHIRNNNTTNNTVQLQHFDPSFLVGKIDPPTNVITNLPQLMGLLKNNGVCNYYRNTDRSRKSIVWYDKEGQEIRDSNGSQIAHSILSALEPDIRKQMNWCREQVNTLEAREDRYNYMEQINHYYEVIRFCKTLLSPFDPKTVGKMTKGISDMAKNQQDVTIDEVADPTPTFEHFTHHLQTVLYPCANQWMNMTSTELGAFLSSKTEDLVLVEPGSKSADTVYIYNDKKQRTPIKSEQLATLISKAIFHITEEMVHGIILEMNKHSIQYNKENADQIEQWFFEPSSQQTKALFEGWCDARR